MPRLIVAFASLVVCLLATGCSSGGPSIPKVTVVTGAVNYQGKPVEGAEVTFSPVTETKEGKPASGTTDAEGKFKLMTYFDPTNELNGAIPGDYLITVTKKDASGKSQEELTKMMQAGQAIPQRKDLLPVKYSFPVDSGLKRTVKAGEKNDFVLDLTD